MKNLLRVYTTQSAQRVFFILFRFSIVGGGSKTILYHMSRRSYG